MRPSLPIRSLCIRPILYTLCALFSCTAVKAQTSFAVNYRPVMSSHFSLAESKSPLRQSFIFAHTSPLTSDADIKLLQKYRHKENTGAAMLILGGTSVLVGALLIRGHAKASAGDQDAVLGIAGGAVLCGIGFGIGIPGLHLKLKYQHKRIEMQQ